MTETEFNRLVDKTLAEIEQALEENADDVDSEITAGILYLDFENDSKIIVNRQTPLQEIWVAAKSGGYHFKWQDERWKDTKTGEELFSSLSRYVSEQAGMPIELRRDA